MKHKAFMIFACLMAFCLVAGMASDAAADYVFSLEARDEGGAVRGSFGRGEDLYLHIIVSDAAGIAGCALTVNYPTNVLIAPDTDQEGISDGVTSIFPFTYDTTQTHRANSSELGKVYLAGAEINTSNGGAKYSSSFEMALFTIKFTVKNDAPLGLFDLSVTQTELLNPDAGWGIDSDQDGTKDTPEPVSVLVGALDNGDPNFGGADLSDDFPVLPVDTSGPLATLQLTATECPDSDGDGLCNSYETNTGTWVSPTSTGTDPNDPDTDNDGLDDGVETNTGLFVDPDDTGTDPNNGDTDSDGLNDGEEISVGTDPFDEDTDGDGVNDGQDDMPLPNSMAIDLNPSVAGVQDVRYVASGSSFTVDIWVGGVADLKSLSLVLNYDSTKLEAVNSGTVEGPFLPQGGANTTFFLKDLAVDGQVGLDDAISPTGTPVYPSGDGVIATVEFNVIGGNTGESFDLTITDGKVFDSNDTEFAVQSAPATIYMGVPGDCSGKQGMPDGYVDIYDLIFFANHWHMKSDDPGWSDLANLDTEHLYQGSQYIDIYDLIQFANNWHQGTPP